MYEKSYFLHLSLKEARNLLGLQAKHHRRSYLELQNQISGYADSRLCLPRDIVADTRCTNAQNLSQFGLSNAKLGHTHFDNIAKAWYLSPFLYGLTINLVILGMCSDETDVQESYRELDNSYQAIVIPHDVEHIPLVSHSIHRIEVLFYVSKTSPFGHKGTKLNRKNIINSHFLEGLSKNLWVAYV